MKPRFFSFLLVSLLLGSCAPIPQTLEASPTVKPSETPTIIATETVPAPTETSVPEQTVLPIALSGPIADASAEVSGLAWYGDNLVLLPQYPNIFDNAGDGFLYYLPKAEILAYIDGQAASPLEPRPIQLLAPGLRESIANYQGFESAGFSGDRVFLTIEAGTGKDMTGHLVAGTIASDLSALTLDTVKLTEIPAQASYANRADEAILVLDDRVITFYEINGVGVNPNPVAHIFGLDLQAQGTLTMPNIEFRITDAALAGQDEFWAINYFFPGDLEQYPSIDPIAAAFGEGPTHAQNIHVERLLKFQLTDSGILLADIPPVQLELNNEIRNWEGLVLLDDRGFLLATDKYPTTLLAFVPLSK